MSLRRWRVAWATRGDRAGTGGGAGGEGWQRLSLRSRRRREQGSGILADALPGAHPAIAAFARLAQRGLTSKSTMCQRGGPCFTSCKFEESADRAARRGATHGSPRC